MRIEQAAPGRWRIQGVRISVEGEKVPIDAQYVEQSETAPGFYRVVMADGAWQLINGRYIRSFTAIPEQ